MQQHRPVHAAVAAAALDAVKRRRVEEPQGSKRHAVITDEDFESPSHSEAETEDFECLSDYEEDPDWSPSDSSGSQAGGRRRQGGGQHGTGRSRKQRAGQRHSAQRHSGHSGFQPRQSGGRQSGQRLGGQRHSGQRQRSSGCAFGKPYRPPKNFGLSRGANVGLQSRCTIHSNLSDGGEDGKEEEEDLEDLEDFDGEEDVDVEELGDVADADLSDVSDGEAPGGRAETYPRAWRSEEGNPAPGVKGFRKYAEAEIQANVPDVEAWSRGKCPAMQSHQEVVALLLHPRSPVSRMLVDQPTGAGKTRSMIAVLDQLFHDKRPKVPIFPRAAVCRNFYEELLRWPSSYRDFFCCVNSAAAALAAGLPEGADWRTCRHDHWSLCDLSESELRALCAELREVLEMKGAISHGGFRSGFRRAFRAKFPGEPLPPAPLRALSYASAGGHHTKFGTDGRPLSAFLKFSYPGGGCVYSKKIVLLDEAHNLVRTQTRYTRQLGHLRKLLYVAKDSVVCGFTGTPMPDDPASGWQLLQTMRGKGVDTGCNEGFLVSMSSKRPPLFPRVHPRGFPDAVLDASLQARLCVKIALDGEALKGYDLKLKAKTAAAKMHSYCNSGCHCCAFHGRRKNQVLRQPANWMPKLAAIAAAICNRPREKCVILISRQGGYKALLALLQRQAEHSETTFTVASAETGLAEFNAPANTNGEQILVLVADSGKFSEGTSFKAVRRLYLADVPTSALELQQQCGRVARMFGHQHLPTDQQSVTTVIPIAVFPDWVRNPLGAWALRACNRKEMGGNKVVQAARCLFSTLQFRRVTTLEELKSAVEAEALAEFDQQDTQSDIGGDNPAHPLSKAAAQLLLDRWGAAHDEERQTVVPALQHLCQIRSLARLSASLASSTADEGLVHSLSAQLAAQVPALKDLREIAIDCDLNRLEEESRIMPSDAEEDLAVNEADFQLRHDEELCDSEEDEHGHGSGRKSVNGRRLSRVTPMKDGDIQVEYARTTGPDGSLRRAPADANRVRRAFACGWKDFLDDLLFGPEARPVSPLQPVGNATLRRLPLPNGFDERVVLHNGRVVLNDDQAVPAEPSGSRRRHQETPDSDVRSVAPGLCADEDEDSDVAPKGPDDLFSDSDYVEDCSEPRRDAHESSRTAASSGLPASSPAPLSPVLATVPSPMRQPLFKHLRQAATGLAGKALPALPAIPVRGLKRGRPSFPKNLSAGVPRHAALESTSRDVRNSARPRSPACEQELVHTSASSSRILEPQPSMALVPCDTADRSMWIPRSSADLPSFLRPRCISNRAAALPASSSGVRANSSFSRDGPSTPAIPIAYDQEDSPGLLGAGMKKPAPCRTLGRQSWDDICSSW